MFAALRRPASDSRDPLEDRCTELLATLIQRHEPVAQVALELFGVAGQLVEGTPTVETQVTTKNRGRVDLVVDLNDECTLWVEVKVDARESGDQLKAYRDELVAQDRSGVLSTLSKYGAKSFSSIGPDELCGGGKHVLWRDLARELVGLAEFEPYVEESVLHRSDLNPLQYDIAQFLVYLNKQGVINMTKPIKREEMDLVAKGEWFDPLQRSIDLFNNAATAAAIRSDIDEGWRHGHVSNTKALGGNTWPDHAGAPHLWIWRNHARVIDNAKYDADEPFPTIEVTLCDCAYWRYPDWAPGDERTLGIVWGLYLRTGKYKPILETDSAVELGDAVGSAVGELDSRFQDGGWRWHGFLPLSDFAEATDQQEALTAALVPRLTELRLAIEEHF